MISSRKQQPSTYTVASRSVVARVINTIRWPFVNRYAAPLWLALRLYIGWIFLQMGLGKIEAGWLSSDPSGDLLKLVANGTMRVPFEFYRGVADMLVGAGVTPLLSHTMPFLELAVALAFFTGVLTPVAAFGAILLNINFILTGIGQISLDGPVILANIMLILSFRVVGAIGFERLAGHILGAALSMARPARRVRANRALQAHAER
jgi:thiosulfate dehydrogenase (quinone) large subunit